MHWMSREWLCKRLRLSLRQSYSLVRPGYGPAISSDTILALINSSRRNIAEPFQYVPSDIVTAEELAQAEEIASTGITAHQLLVWTRRTKAVPPHIRINKQTTRFVKSAFFKWLAERTAARYRAW